MGCYWVSSLSSESITSSPFKYYISLTLVGTYPSALLSTNGETWGGGGIPGLYGEVGNKYKKFTQSTKYYGWINSLF